jgi:hypothetical protein
MSKYQTPMSACLVTRLRNEMRRPEIRAAGRDDIAAPVDELTVVTPEVFDNYELALRDIYHGHTQIGRPAFFAA